MNALFFTPLDACIHEQCRYSHNSNLKFFTITLQIKVSLVLQINLKFNVIIKLILARI